MLETLAEDEAEEKLIFQATTVYVRRTVSLCNPTQFKGYTI